MYHMRKAHPQFLSGTAGNIFANLIATLNANRLHHIPHLHLHMAQLGIGACHGGWHATSPGKTSYHALSSTQDLKIYTRLCMVREYSAKARANTRTTISCHSSGPLYVTLAPVPA